MNTAALPIDAVLPDIQRALRAHNRALLVAQPGAGKTTRVPLSLLENTPCGQRWLLLEPRRVAARLAAAFMAEQLGEAVGQTVGYRVRGESRVSPETRVEVLTQGILTRLLQDDPELPGVAGLIFDEFHERSLDADTGLALALDVQHGLRQDLKILVMSATLDTRALLSVLGEDTPLIDCPGRSWPVSTFYRSMPLREYPEIHLAGLVREAMAAHQGHILVFLPGQSEIRRLEQLLHSSLADDADICPLHGQMPLAAQQAVLRPAPDSRRRIILSTAIAESSVTVPGVRIVIDAGRERVPVYQPRTGLSRLETRRVNRASADQRRGRAGREAAGFCYRAWSEDSILAAHREPEMLQSDLSQLVFELTRWGVTEPGSLTWIHPPPAPAVLAGRQLLQMLGLINSEKKLTVLGNQCARWPTHPRLAVLLEHARRHPQRLALACWLSAWLEEQPGASDIDLQVVMRRPCASQLRPGLERPRGAEETSAVVAERVAAARQRMLQRNLDGLSNGQLSGHQLGQCGRISSAALDLWQQAVDQRGLSARAAERLLRVARTIADLEASLEVEASALAEALSYRSFDQPPQGL